MDYMMILHTYNNQWTTNIIFMVVTHFVLLLLILTLYQNFRISLGTKRYVKKSFRLRKKKYSGIVLNKYTERHRKRNTNNYKNLHSKSKAKITKYFEYKLKELPGITNYSYGKTFKHNKKKLFITVCDNKKGIHKIKIKHAFKDFIDLVNQYECLDEFVLYLHNLPDALLNHQEYDIYIYHQDTTIGFEVL